MSLEGDQVPLLTVLRQSPGPEFHEKIRKSKVLALFGEVSYDKIFTANRSEIDQTLLPNN